MRFSSGQKTNQSLTVRYFLQGYLGQSSRRGGTSGTLEWAFEEAQGRFLVPLGLYLLTAMLTLQPF
jgi:hypothetical protein